jgi:DNA-binding transcriptional ArsR family regulator
MSNHTVTKQAQVVFRALADPNRRAILDLLRQKSLSAGQIAQAFPVSRPAISKHLRLLRRANLVAERRQGRQRFYRLNPGPLRTVDSWVSQYRTFWQTSLTNLKAFVESEGAQKTSRPWKKWKM